jgi:serine/threonine kinase 33
MENYDGGELVSKIRDKSYCSEEDVRIIISRLADAVAYLHEQGIVHRDLKPENILLSTEDPEDMYNIKVMDFGLATCKDSSTMIENICGTPFYMAPEVVDNLGYSQQCDIWSIGIMMYLLLVGYKKECEVQLHQMISNRKIEFPDENWKNISIGAKNLVENLLKFDPAQRITAKEILQHPWIHGEENGVSTNTTVFDLMKSYKAEKRLKKIINVVIAAIYFCNGTFKVNHEPVINDTEELNEKNLSNSNISDEKKPVKNKSINRNKVKGIEERSTGKLPTRSHIKTDSNCSCNSNNGSVQKLNLLSSSDKTSAKRSSSNAIKSKTHESDHISSPSVNHKVISKQTNSTNIKTQIKKNSISPETMSKSSNVNTKSIPKRISICSTATNTPTAISNRNENSSPLTLKKNIKDNSNSNLKNKCTTKKTIKT